MRKSRKNSYSCIRVHFQFSFVCWIKKWPWFCRLSPILSNIEIFKEKYNFRAENFQFAIDPDVMRKSHIFIFKLIMEKFWMQEESSSRSLVVLIVRKKRVFQHKKRGFFGILTQEVWSLPESEVQLLCPQCFPSVCSVLMHVINSIFPPKIRSRFFGSG